LVIVQLGVVVLYAVKEEVARLLQEGVDGKIKRLKVGSQGHSGELRIGAKSGQARGEVELGLLRGRCRELMEVRSEQMRVVHNHGQFGEDVLVAKTALLKAVSGSVVGSSDCRTIRGANLPLGGEFPLLVSGNELRRQPVGPKTEAALRASADVVNESHCPLIGFLLVEILVLDGVDVDKVAHVGAHVPADILSIYVDLAQELDHLVLVSVVRLGPGSGGGLTLAVVVVA